MNTYVITFTKITSDYYILISIISVQFLRPELHSGPIKVMNYLQDMSIYVMCEFREVVCERREFTVTCSPITSGHLYHQC